MTYIKFAPIKFTHAIASNFTKSGALKFASCWLLLSSLNFSAICAKFKRNSKIKFKISSKNRRFAKFDPNLTYIFKIG